MPNPRLAQHSADPWLRADVVRVRNPARSGGSSRNQLDVSAPQKRWRGSNRKGGLRAVGQSAGRRHCQFIDEPWHESVATTVTGPVKGSPSGDLRSASTVPTESSLLAPESPQFDSATCCCHGALRSGQAQPVTEEERSSRVRACVRPTPPFGGYGHSVRPGDGRASSRPRRVARLGPSCRRTS